MKQINLSLFRIISRFREDLLKTTIAAQKNRKSLIT